MSISIKIEKSFSKLGQDRIQKAKEKFYAEAAAALPPLIVELYNKGISPVEGVGKFKQYSKSYVEQIEHNRKADKKNVKQGEKNLKKGLAAVDKRKHGTAEIFRGKLRSPVNLKLTGFMHKSIRSFYNNESTTVLFDSPIAKYHNGQGKVDRHILPKGNEKFTSLIMKKLRDILRNAFNQ